MAGGLSVRRRVGVSRAGWLLSLCLAGFACQPALLVAPERAEGPGGSAHYHVRVDESLTAMWVRVCFGGEPPRAMLPMDPAAVPLLVDAYDSEGETIPHGEAIPLENFGPGDCVHYEVDLESASRDSRDALRRRGDMLVVQQLWLWAPSERPDTASFGVTFELPRGMFASVPWPREGDGYSLPASTFQLEGNTVFSFVEPLQFERADVAIEIAVLPGELSVDGDSLETWIGSAVDAVAGLYGTFPAERLHIVIVPAGPGLSPVAFGLVRRGGGASVMLLVHEDASEDGLVGDWTAVHEFSHLALPRMKREDAWLSEGIATYYQEVLRARAGIQTEKEAWRRILDGFQRGRRVGTDRMLADESRDMRETGAFRRVYWSGTAFALEADVLLRKEAGLSMDQMISRSQGAWPRRTVWQGSAAMHRFDRLSGRGLLVPLFERYARLRKFPDVGSLLKQLGIEGDSRSVTLDDDVPLAHLRQAIMSSS